MAAQKGSDFLLKMGNEDGPPETFTTIGAARTNTLTINNAPVDATTMEDDGVQVMLADAGVQTMQISIDGIFKDAGKEEDLRAAAFGRTENNFQLVFPNGDEYEAAFVIQDYNRTGAHDGVETFSATLIRSADGTFTAAA